MLLASGIVLPGSSPLTLKKISDGLYVAINAYEYDAGYFGQAPLYLEQRGKPPEKSPEPPVSPETVSQTGS